MKSKLYSIQIRFQFLRIIAFLIPIIGFQNITFSQTQPSVKPVKVDSILKKEQIDNIKKSEKTIAFSGNDGPYIIDDSLLYRISFTKKLQTLLNFRRDSIAVYVDNNFRERFYVDLDSAYTIPKTIYNAPEKMIVLSDIEGNFNAFSGFLMANKVIDQNYNWIYGNGHLVLNGDFVDRGKNVTQVLWLIYKLDQQAKAQNGNVHFILGNHEILNFYGDHRYNRGKYIKAAQTISGFKNKKQAVKFIYSKRSEIGKWLSTKNVIEKIGDYIFVHAGLHPELLTYNITLEEINSVVRKKYYDISDIETKTQRFLYSEIGPFWYRGLARKEISSRKLKNILNYYNARTIVIGHTPVKNIKSSFGGKLINTDVHHENEKFSSKTKGLLIENNMEYIVNAMGEKILLQDD